MKYKILVVFILGLATTSSLFGAAITSTAAGGNWNNAASWVGGIPGAGDDVTIVSTATITVNVSSACLSLTLNGAAILDFPTNGITLTVNGTMTMNGTSQVTGNNNNRILSLLGDFNIPAGQVASIGGVRITQALAKTFNLGGTFMPTDNTGIKTFGQANFYDGCFLDANVTESVFIAGNLAVLPTTPGLHSQIGRITLTVLGTTTVTGYLEFKNSNAGVKTFSGTITVSPGGVWDNIVGEDPVVNCDIVNNGLWPQPTGGNGRYNVTGAGTYTYSGSREIAFTRLLITTAATVTNNGILKLTQNANAALTVNGSGIFNNGDGVTAGYLLFTSVTASVSVGGGGSIVNFANANNTVEYAATAAQTIYATTYDKLICSSGQTATVNGTVTVNTALTISGATIVDVTGGTDLNGAGTLTMTGTSLLRLSSAGVVPALTGTPNSLAAGTTIELNRAGAQTAASSAIFPYQNLKISGNAGSIVAFNQVSDILGNLTLTSAGRFATGINTPPLISVLGDFTYSSTNTTTLNTAMNVGSVSITSGTFTYTNNTITINQDNGFWSITGAPVINAGGVAKVIFTSGVGQEISGPVNPSFQTLVINNTNDVTVNVPVVSVAFNLTLTNGRLITGTNRITMAAASTTTRTNGFVEGNLNKAFAVGTSTQTYEVGTNTDYTPASITCTSVTTAGTLTVASVELDHPEINSALIEPSNTANRYWQLTNVGMVFSAFSAGQIAGTFNFVDGDEDPALDNSAIIKWYNNSTLTWTGADQFDQTAEQNPVMTVATDITANTSTFAVMNPNQLPAGQAVDFQIGEKIDPTYVYNRLTGANNWNNAQTWIQQRSGLITLNGTNTITGTPGVTNFGMELTSGDKIMLLTDPATVYTIVTIGPGESMTVNPVPGISATAGFGRQYIPGISSPTSDVDAVVIGNTSIADATTTITLDINAKILTLDIGSTSRTTAQILTHQNSTRTLTVLANASVNQPSGVATNTWNINDAVANVAGDVSIGGVANNTITRIGRVNITTGTLDAGNLKFKTFASNTREAQAVLNVSGVGTVTLRGAIAFSSNRGTLISAVGSTINFVRSSSGQTVSFPASNTTAVWAYHNILLNNTSASGANWGFTSTATTVTGDVKVVTGQLGLPGFNLVGAVGKSFQVADGATFVMSSGTAAVGGFPSGFGTITLGPNSTVAYNQTGNTNPWPVVTTAYGNLIIGQNASIRHFALANATTTVAGNLTIGDGTSAAFFQGTTASVLTVSGNILINALATLDATNIATINAGGNWTDDGNFTESTNLVTFNSPAANVLQTIGGASAETFNNLTLNTSAATDLVRLNNTTTVTNNLVLTLGGLDLNSNTLTINNSLVTAISRTSGYIKSEDIGAPYGTISWFINNSTGVHTYPFGKSATEFIPFILNVTVAGTKGIGTGYVPVSTYATAATNPPAEYPSTVNNLNGTSGGTSVTDRYWNITLGSPEFATTRPTATITFTALNTEKPTTWTAIGEPPTNPNFLLAQRWNPANYWDPAQSSPAQTYANNSPAAGTFQVGVPSVSSFSTSWTITDSSVPLPIELVEFVAKPGQGWIELSWRTETEFNNDKFTVQRTLDTEKFEDIVSLKGAGTTTSSQSYSTMDYRPLAGKSYYRLKQTDFDGNVSYSKLVAVNMSESLTWGVYPNPSNGSEFTISFGASDIGKQAFIKVQDIGGKEQLQVSTESLNSTQLKIEPTQKLSPGMYIISVAVEQEIVRFKLIVR